MKNSILFILVISIVAFSCGKPDKKAELAELKKQHDELTQKISTLEAELAKESGGIIDQSQLQGVSIQEVKTADFSHYIEVQGKLDGDENIGISPRMNGVVKQVIVNEGDAVKKDQILAILDDEILQQSMKELKTGLEFATNIYNKQKALWDQKIGSEIQYLTAKNNKESLEQKLETLKNQLDLTRIKSPINGTIEEITLKVGQMAVAGVPACRVVNFSSVKITADVAESYSSKIRKGDKVLVHFPDVNQDVEATISFTSKYINPINRTFQVEVRFSSVGTEFKANMIAVIKIQDYKAKDAITLPINVIQTDNTGSYVYVTKTEGNKMIAEKRLLKQGQSYNGLVEITEGLKVGDKLIVTGFQNLEEGQEIKL